MTENTTNPPDAEKKESKSLEQELEKLRLESILPSNLEQGLSNEEVDNRLQRFGKNGIPENHRPLILQFLDHFIGINQFCIEICFIVALALSDWVEAGIIIFLLVLNAVVGFRQQYQAGNAIAALKQGLSLHALCRRLSKGSNFQELPAEELVPGDLIIVAR